MTWTHLPQESTLSSLCRSSSPRQSLIFCCGVTMFRRRAQDSHKTGPVNERERNNRLPCKWQVKPEVLHREHSLRQILVNCWKCELEIVPVAALQRGAPNEIVGERCVVVKINTESMKHIAGSSTVKPTQDSRGSTGTQTSGIGTAPAIT